jgi:hypothetical protein
MNTKIKLRKPEAVIAEFPEMIIIDKPVITGVVVDGQGVETQVTHPIDRGYRMAGHIVKTGSGEKFHAVPWMKSEGYKEMSHVHTLSTVCENLDKRGLKHGVWKSDFNRNFGVLKTDILLKETYKIDEDCFENKLSTTYNDQTPEDVGVYQPMVRLTNSFFGASALEFALVRIICLNGMMRIADKLRVKFEHLRKDTIENFTASSDAFLENVFAKKTLENMIIDMSNEPIGMEAFLGWMVKMAGPRAVEKTIEQYNLEQTSYLDSTPVDFNSWMAYNMMTWVTSHIVSSHHKQQRMYVQFNQLRADVAEQ